MQLRRQVSREKRTLRNNTILLLQALKKMRSSLLDDLLNQHPRVFEEMFRFENSPTKTSLAMKRYFLSWYESFWPFLNAEIESSSNMDKDSVHKDGILVFSKLLDIYLESISDISESNFFTNIVRDKKKLIEEILKFGERAEQDLQILAFSHAKDKALLEREFKRLKEE